MNKYNFKSSELGTTSKEKNSKYTFKPSIESKNAIARNSDSTSVQNVNKIMRFNKEG